MKARTIEQYKILKWIEYNFALDLSRLLLMVGRQQLSQIKQEQLQQSTVQRMEQYIWRKQDAKKIFSSSLYRCN